MGDNKVQSSTSRQMGQYNLKVGRLIPQGGLGGAMNNDIINKLLSDGGVSASGLIVNDDILLAQKDPNNKLNKALLSSETGLDAVIAKADIQTHKAYMLKDYGSAENSATLSAFLKPISAAANEIRKTKGDAEARNFVKLCLDPNNDGKFDIKDAKIMDSYTKLPPDKLINEIEMGKYVKNQVSDSIGYNETININKLQNNQQYPDQISTDVGKNKTTYEAAVSAIDEGIDKYSLFHGNGSFNAPGTTEETDNNVNCNTTAKIKK